MAKISELKQQLEEGKLDERLLPLYGEEKLDASRKRYLHVLSAAQDRFGDREALLFSAPGRTEVGGNHTDHQLGRVLAAAINLDIIAAVLPNQDQVIRYEADDFKVKPVSLDVLTPSDAEKNTTESLIRGIAAWFHEHSFATGGFDLFAESEVLPGSGMSSSAAFETLIGTIMSDLYNEGKADAIMIAKAGQYAENAFFGKASGLMDQMASSVGGFVTIDFRDKENPQVRKVDYDFAESGHVLVLTDCRQSHADLSDEYSRIPSEMREVAKVLGGTVMSDCTMDQLMDHASEVREKCGDRAFLRSYHFLKETDRVLTEVGALENKDFAAFLRAVRQSGYSSYMYLQNVYPPNDRMHQSLAVGLAISEQLLNGHGAYRVHGGGFAGTIQAFVPADMAEEYIREMTSVFGGGCCYQLQIRDAGGIQVY